MKPKLMNFSIKEIILIAIFASLTAVLSQISIKIPVSPVPITMQTIAVCLAAIILGKKCGTISQVTYILTGAVGFPVFSAFNSGLGALVGPTGGYIISFPFMAFTIGYISEKLEEKFVDKDVTKFKLNPKYARILSMFLAMLSGLIVCYIFGTLWLGFSLKLSFQKALLMGIGFYLPLDIIKIFLASFLTYEVRGALIRARLLV